MARRKTGRAPDLAFSVLRTTTLNGELATGQSLRQGELCAASIIASMPPRRAKAAQRGPRDMGELRHAR